ncbi:hypothetical protein CEXT_90561 [Caerostris extrusa]|uniref:Uncharacterized protein n=1 Tax=Caerostris extrusa TaxID=172846 RepID=A0AAV4MHX2_CAEEX|nr:hypothetical protein CEXT_90561 [Caerostris extrusa]
MSSTIIPRDGIIYRVFEPENSSIVFNEMKRHNVSENFYQKDNEIEDIRHPLMNTKLINNSVSKKQKIKDSRKSSDTPNSTKKIFEIFIHYLNNSNSYKSREIFRQNSNESKDTSKTLMNTNREKQLYHTTKYPEEIPERRISTQKLDRNGYPPLFQTSI